MEHRCISLTGYAGDRTAEGMVFAARLAEYLSNRFGLPHQHFGVPETAMDIPWDDALRRSAALLDQAKSLYETLMAAQSCPLLVTPRCAAAIGTIPVVQANHPDIVVLWLDAHGDLNTPDTSGSGYLGGMPLAAALGEWDSGYGAGLTPDRTVHIGGRNLDAPEKALIDARGITALRFADVEQDLRHLQDKIAGRSVYIHLDLDVFDPSEVTAEFAEPNGLTRSDGAAIMETVAARSRLVGIEVMELSPRSEDDFTSSCDAVGSVLAPLFGGTHN